MEQLNQANLVLLDRVHQYRNSKSIILDLDSTYADKYGDQEDATFNAHYRTIGLHPLVASDGFTGDWYRKQPYE